MLPRGKITGFHHKVTFISRHYFIYQENRVDFEIKKKMKSSHLGLKSRYPERVHQEEVFVNLGWSKLVIHMIGPTYLRIMTLWREKADLRSAPLPRWSQDGT